jgi:hypothetical protein
MDPAAWLRQQLEHADVDLLREMVRAFADALMSADADAVCGAAYGAISAERTNRRYGYRRRDWDTRAGTIELSVPKLRTGSYFPLWLLEPRRRAEQALTQVIADCYLAGVSTRRVDKLVQQLALRLSRGPWKLRWGPPCGAARVRRSARPFQGSDGGPRWQDRTRPRPHATRRSTRAR